MICSLSPTCLGKILCYGRAVTGLEQRAALTALIERDGVSLATLSRVLARNPAWMQQYLRRGTPRLLAEDDRARLARFFGVDEGVLGAPQRDGLVAVRGFDLAASAGRGRVVDGDPPAAPVGYSTEELARIGVSPAAISTIAVEGDSMQPTLHAGDRILVDHDQRTPGARDAIWVIRIDDALRVKRLMRAGADWRIISDNPSWTEDRRPARDVEVIGRVVHLMRRL